MICSISSAGDEGGCCAAAAAAQNGIVIAAHDSKRHWITAASSRSRLGELAAHFRGVLVGVEAGEEMQNVAIPPVPRVPTVLVVQLDDRCDALVLQLRFADLRCV